MVNYHKFNEHNKNKATGWKILQYNPSKNVPDPFFDIYDQAFSNHVEPGGKGSQIISTLNQRRLPRSNFQPQKTETKVEYNSPTQRIIPTCSNIYHRFPNYLRTQPHHSEDDAISGTSPWLKSVGIVGQPRILGRYPERSSTRFRC